MLSAEEPVSNDQAPGPIIARVRSQQFGSNLVFDHVWRMVGVGPAWARCDPTWLQQIPS